MSDTVAIDSTQQARLKKRFAAWDSDNDGRLERSDFEQEALDTARAFGRSADAPEVQNLRTAYLGMFDEVARRAGVPDALTEDQFVSAGAGVLQQGEEATAAMLRPVTDAVVGLCDRDADGVISVSEFVSWLTAIGKSEAEALETFRQVDTNGNGELSREELLVAVRDFQLGRSSFDLLP